jgi:2-polyprenyl-3-methyl-5-hydroxy-6-metoxy-1,4-benzoquinol methylase
VIHGTVESASFEPASFEAITFNHVIEHLVDPIATLQHSAGLLAPGGRIIITTPNVRSWGHRRFGASWLGLDPPRHIHLFTPRSLVRCAENARLEVVDVRTPARWAFWIWQTSATLKRRRVLPGADITGAGVGLKAMAAMFWMTEYVASRVRPVGEEVLLIARRSM